MPFESNQFTVTKIRKRVYRLEHSMKYRARDRTFTVPKGFTTDYATVPVAVRWLFPSDDDWTQAAILHDYFCDQFKDYMGDKDAFLRKYGFTQPEVDSSDADGIFRRCMKEPTLDEHGNIERPGVTFPRRWVMWTGVRWGAVFSKHRSKGNAKDLPKMLLVSILAAPLVVPFSIVVWFGLLIDWCVNKVAGLFCTS